VGIAAIYSDTVIGFGGQSLTASIVTMSILGALVMYVISMLSLFRLRRLEPGLARPFKAFGHPYVPAIALLLAITSLAALVYYNRLMSEGFLALFGLFACYFLATKKMRSNALEDPCLARALARNRRRVDLASLSGLRGSAARTPGPSPQRVPDR
jgi:ethanolamine permease